jgi:Protein of unknown function (DUF4242)
MAEFLLEVYATRTDSRSIDEAARRARAAAESFAFEGPYVRYVRSIFVPEDETCFYVYEADSVETVREVAHRAGLSVDRVVEARSAEQRGDDS